MNFKRFSTSDNQWYDVPYYQHKSATDTLTLPAVIYPNDTSITVGLKGNEEHTGTPTPQNPVDVNGTGERTANLLDKTAFTTIGSTIEQIKDGIRITTQSNGYAACIILDVLQNTDYRISYIWKNISGSSTNTVRVFAGTDTSTQIAIFEYSNGGTFNTGNNKKINIWFYAAFGAAATVEYTNIMLNTGSTALPYEPWGVKIPISSASTTTPVYLGEVETTRKIKKLVLTGEEDNWKKSTAYQGNFFNTLLDTPAYTIPILCSHAVYTQQITPTLYVYGKCTVDGSGDLKNLNLFIGEPSWSVSDFQQYLAQQYAAGTPVTIWYVLATEETGIVNEPLRKIGDYADSLTTSIPCTAGENTLDVQTTVQPSEVSLTYTGWHDANAKIYLNGAWTDTPTPPVTSVVYGWHVDPSIADSSNAVTYLEDAVGMTPAAMGASTFDYGSWEDAFFMPKPCMVRSNGEVAYYLDPNDYSKKADGTPSDVANPDFDGNAMMEWGKIWYKFAGGETDGEGYFYVSNEQVDDSYHCWCNYDSKDNITDHFYTAIYNGTGTTKLRSISGVALTSANGNGKTNVTQEVARATANNTTADVEWYTDVWSDRLLINALLVLIGKSLDTQATFGRGLDTGSQTAKEAYVTGTLNDKGLFWGDTANGTSAVKVFGMENWWACCWRRIAGCISVKRALKIKLTYGTADGSTTVGYNQTGNGYISNGTIPSSNNCVRAMTYNQYGYMTSNVTGGSSSTYYADYFYQNTGTRYLLVGGDSGYGVYAGAFSFSLDAAPSVALWVFAAALSCKPLAQKG